MEQQQVTSTYSEDEIEQNIASFPIAGYLNTRVLVKEIQKEKQKISLLEKEKEIVLSESELLRETVSKCDEDTRIFHEQARRSNEICDSHKKNNDVLERHIFELVYSLNLESQKECNDKKLYNQVSSTYQDKWQEYFATYSKHLLFPRYEEAKRRHIELKEYLKSSESQLRQLQADVFRIKCERSRKNSEENKYFPLQNFVVWIAQLKHDTMNVEKEVRETHRDCTELKTKLKLLQSEIQKKKSFLESTESLSDQMQQRDNGHLGNYEQRANIDSRSLRHFSPPQPPVKPKIAHTGHKFTFFIPKLISVTSLSKTIFSSQQSDTHRRVSPGTDGKAKSPSYFRQSTSPVTEMLSIPLECTTPNVPTTTAVSPKETSVFRASFYTPSQDSNTALNVTKNNFGDISSTKVHVDSIAKNNCNMNFKSCDNFAPAISSSDNGEGMTYPLNTQEDVSTEIKKESKVSPYFLGTPKLDTSKATPYANSSTINQDFPSNMWKQNTDTTVDPTDLCSSRKSTSAVTSLNSRSFSPFDIKKHVQTLEDMQKSPGFDYKSRNMYTVGGSNDKTVHNENASSPTSKKHEIMESEMFCSSLFHSRTAEEKYELRIPENATTSPRVGREDTFCVEKLCDSPLAAANTEKSLFSFDTAADNKPTCSSVFSLFGDDDTETSSATACTSNFLFNFRPSQEEKTESTSFKFLF